MTVDAILAVAIGGYLVLQVAALVVWALRRPARRAAVATRERAEARGWAALRRACLRGRTGPAETRRPESASR